MNLLSTGIKTKKSQRIVWLVLSVLLLIPCLIYPANGIAEANPWHATTLKRDTLTALMDKAKISLDELDKQKDLPAETLSHHRAALQEHLTLLTELISIIDRANEIDEMDKVRPNEMARLEKELNRYHSLPDLIPPTNPDQKIFQKTWDELSERLALVDVLSREVRDRENFLTDLPVRISQSQTRLETAQKQLEVLQTEYDQEKKESRKAVLRQQLDNTHLLVRLARERLMLWEREEAFERTHSAFRERELELARVRHQRQADYFALYQDALKVQQSVEAEEHKKALAQKEKDALTAQDPWERLLNDREAEVLRVQANLVDMERFKAQLATETLSQEATSKSEKEELLNLKNLVELAGARGPVAEVLKDTFSRIKPRRKALKLAFKGDMRRTLNQYQDRLAQVGNLLFNLEGHWKRSIDRIIRTLPVEEERRFGDKSDKLKREYRQLLGQERRLLRDVMTDAQKLELVIEERNKTLNRLEQVVLSRIFWIQDAQPYQFQTLLTILDEMLSLDGRISILSWWLSIISTEMVKRLWSLIIEPSSLLQGAFLFGLLPALLLYFRKRLKLWVQQRADDRETVRESFGGRFIVVVAAVVGSLFFPLYLVMAGLTFGASDLPGDLGLVTESVFFHFAAFFPIWFLSRLLFGPSGIMEVHFNMPEDMAATLRSGLNVASLGYFSFLLPWSVLQEHPFNFEALPRLGFTLFEGALILAIYQVIRPGSPLIRRAFASKSSGAAQKSASLLDRHWPKISWILILFMVVMLVLDMAGYRFGAKWLAINGLLSLATLFALIGIYRLLMAGVQRLVVRRNLTRKALGQVGGDPGAGFRLLKQARHLLWMVLSLTGFWLLARYWGINQAALDSLQQQALFSVSDASGGVLFVTVADLMFFLLTLAVTIWFLRQLPTLFELLIYPRMREDQSMRYAVLTITRYTLFIVGFIFSLSFLHLDYSKVGWLVAAMSVGLGFGLQEIVANFVSGIILLIERPIGVGDAISIGPSGEMARVTNINIRATTVRNMSRQEIIVPNRTLITQDVVNWTRSDAILRIMMPIGVSYNSDIGKVRRVLNDLVSTQSGVLKDPAPQIFFMNYGMSSLDFQVRVFLPNPDLRNIVRDRLNDRIFREFKKEGIEIPFPQQDLHIRSVEESVVFQGAVQGKVQEEKTQVEKVQEEKMQVEKVQEEKMQVEKVQEKRVEKE
ncbi:MAG: mechanosensitive ion channel [Magnetococcales bacterium]|nr:mechanosensitive ion channel [Magnetococcales bacterium]